VVAVIAEGGNVSTDGRVAIDRKDLTYATLASTDVVLDRLYCSSRGGWERLCDETPSQRTVTVRAELTAVGEREGDRYTSHDEIFVCRFLEVGSYVSRDADGTVWVDDAALSRLIPWLTYITDGTTFLRALCRM
jgi:hypothetical protein